MLEFKLPDMTCGHCASTVAKTCRLVDPQAKVDVDLDTRVVRVTSSEDAVEFAQALAEAGYPPAH
jgi:copper chaperone